jgi:glycosyltransferase involved in cell wall biosynthesis
MIEKMYRANSDKIVISAHGDFNHIFPVMELNKNACREQLKLPKDKRMYLFPGTVKPYKGLNYLISTFKEWNNPHVVLVVAGKVGRSIEESLGELPANVIVHNKFIPDNELPLYFHAADWTVVPYQRILSSATILTAMGMGSAIIAPEMGILPDYCDEKGSILYNSNEKNALQSTLEKSLNLPAETMGDYNKQKVKKFDWKEISTDTINVLKNL